MPINLPGVPFKLTSQDMGVSDLGEAIKSGFKTYQQGTQAAYTPKVLAESLLSSQLANKLKQGQIGLLPLKQQLLQAKINQAKKGPRATGELAQLFNLREQFPEGSPDRALVDQAIKNKAAGSSGTQLSIDPNTGAINFIQGGTRGASPQIATDSQGNQYILNKPTTASQTAFQKQASANVARELAAEHLKMPYMGFASTLNIANDLAIYNKNPDSKEGKEAAKRLVDAAVSERLVPEIASLQLASQGITPSVYALKFQQQAITQGWPISLKLAVNNLPQKLQQQVKKEHDIKLKKLNKVRAEYQAKGFPLKVNSSQYNDEDLEHTAQKYGISKEEVIRRLGE